MHQVIDRRASSLLQAAEQAASASDSDARQAAVEAKARALRSNVVTGATVVAGVAAEGVKLGWTFLRTLVKG